MKKKKRQIDSHTEKQLSKIRELRAEKEKPRKKRLMIFRCVLLLILLAAITVMGILLYQDWKEKQSAAEGGSPEILETASDTDALVTEAPAVIVDASATDASATGTSDTDASTEEPEKINTEIEMSFVGDCMLASMKGKMDEGCFNWYADNYPTTYFFDKVRYIFEDDDFTVANCENVFTDRDIPERDKPWTPAFWFKSKAKNAKIFADNSIEAVTVANNHTLDYGEEGAEDTKKALDDAGVMWGENDEILYLEKDGFTVAVVCVSLCGTRGGGGSYDAALETVPYLKTAEENSDFQVMYFHGGVEGSYEVPAWEKDACHMFVDEGADLVIGSHPHYLQPREEYNGVEIVYSLGNFCFGGNNQPKNRTIIYQYTIKVEDDRITAEESNMIPCYVYTGNVNNWQPAVIEDQDKIDRVLSFMDGERENPN